MMNMMNMVFWFINMDLISFIQIIKKFMIFYHVLQNGMIIVMKLLEMFMERLFQFHLT